MKNKKATWYPCTGIVTIEHKDKDIVLLADTWHKAVHIAKMHECSEITDTLKRWGVIFNR